TASSSPAASTETSCTSIATAASTPRPTKPSWPRPNGSPPPPCRSWAGRASRGRPDETMAEPQTRTFRWRFKHPAPVIWPLLADTVRFNEAAGLPRYEVTETLQADGSVLFEGRLKQGPLVIAWREIPQNWVAPRW